MGNPKQKWTAEEEEALRAGVAKYGPGKWKFIQRDPEFNKHLNSRSNIDLKDKWRNMSAAAGQGSREKLRTPKARPIQDSPANSVVTAQTPSPSVRPLGNTPADVVKDESSKDLPDAKNGPRYNALIYEALSTTKESAGLDLSALVSFIEQRMEVPQTNFRKVLGSRLRRLVSQEKLEKVDNCFRIKDKSLSERTNTNFTKNSSSLKNEGVIQSQLSLIAADHLSTNVAPSHDMLAAAAKFAACKIAEAEEMSCHAAEAVAEAERVVRMADEAAEVLRFANEIFEKCIRGEVVPIA